MVMLQLLLWVFFGVVVVVVWIVTKDNIFVRYYTVRRLRISKAWLTPSAPIVIPPKRTIALVFVNSKSGGQLGPTLIQYFASLLDKVQVFDLAAQKPAAVLMRYQHCAPDSVRIMCCGGDGTVGWVLSACSSLNLKFPIGVMPLGTGNDMARALGWGAGVQCADKRLVAKYLTSLAKSSVSMLDIWNVSISSPSQEAAAKRKELLMNNYFSLGIDAEVALRFHEERLLHPERFTSQAKNVLKYAMLGFEGAFEGMPLEDSVRIFDGETGDPIEFNDQWKGIVVSNIPCYQGGKRFWRDDLVDDTFIQSEEDAKTNNASSNNGKGFFYDCVQDGKLEVMALSGTLHIGMVHLAVDGAIKLAQRRKLRIEITDDVCMQLDGEPWRQRGPCTVEIFISRQARMLRPKEGVH